MILYSQETIYFIHTVTDTLNVTHIPSSCLSHTSFYFRTLYKEISILALSIIIIHFNLYIFSCQLVVSHILLNQAATLSFISFSLILLKLWTIFVCLAFIYLTLYIFGAASVFIFNCVVAGNNNLCVSLTVYVARSQYICIQKLCATFIYNWPTTLY